MSREPRALTAEERAAAGRLLDHAALWCLGWPGEAGGAVEGRMRDLCRTLAMAGDDNVLALRAGVERAIGAIPDADPPPLRAARLRRIVAEALARRVGIAP